MLVEVTKEKLAITQGGHINEGEMNVNTCLFSLPECFEGLNVTACFNGIPVPIVKNSCTIPALKQGTATLGVYAYKENEDGIELIYSPEPTCFCVHNGSFTEEPEQELTFEISEYEQYCNMIKGEYEKTEALFTKAEEERNEAEALRTNAENMRQATFSENEAKRQSAFENAESQRTENYETLVESIVSAEAQREAAFDGYKTYIDQSVSAMENDLKNSCANAFRGNVTEKVIRVDDVSPIEHTTKISVRGKNLFNRDNLVNLAMGAEILSGDNYIGYYIPCKEGDVFSVSRSELTNSRFRTCFTCDEPANKVTYFGGTGSSYQYDKQYKIENQVAPMNANYFFVYLSNSNEAIPDIQIEKGEMVTEYEPYIELSEVKLSRCGKNLFDPSEILKASKDTTLNGDAFTTNFVNSSLYLNIIGSNRVAMPSGTYTITIVPVSEEVNFIFYAYDSETSELILKKQMGTYDNVCKHTFTTTSSWFPSIGGRRLEDGSLLGEYSYKIQLEVGDVATEYEVCNVENYTPNANGNVEMLSISPSMTLFTDTDEVIIDLEYNRDLNKITAAMYDYIDSMIGGIENGSY